MQPLRRGLARGSIACIALCVAVGAVNDERSLTSGTIVLTDDYLDQPYVAQWSNASVTNRWVMTITRNSHPEGEAGEHIEVLHSDDRGVSWSSPVAVEPTPLTNAYSVIMVTDFGRIMVVYNMNADNVTRLPNGSPVPRDDMIDRFMMRFSDDGGESWSLDRFEVPVRLTAIDRNNTWKGAVKILWAVDQAKTRPPGDGDDGRIFWGFTKVGQYELNPPEEVFLISSPNARSERNASKVIWETLPAGDVGIAPPGGNPAIGEEPHVVPLHSGGMFMVMRTTQRYLGAASTADPTGASGWTNASFATFWSASPAALGRHLKQGRGPSTLKLLASGRYVLLYYNQGTDDYTGRNPYWLAVGVEEEGVVRFSQPEVVLYDYIDTQDRPGYPDFIEMANGSLYITETNKTVARTHLVNASLLAGLLMQDTAAAVAGGASLQWGHGDAGNVFPTPPLPSFELYRVQNDGVTLGLCLLNHSLSRAGEVFVDTVASDGRGPSLSLTVSAGGGVNLRVSDANGVVGNLTTDPACAGRLASPGIPHYLAATIDTGAHLLTLAVDGVLCDGDTEAPAGWAWVDADAGSLAPGAPSFVLAGNYSGILLGGGWWARMLTVSEAVANYRAGPPRADEDSKSLGGQSECQRQCQ